MKAIQIEYTMTNDTSREKMTENTERIHIALSPWDLTDDYNRHAGVTMLSVLDHCASPVTIHLLYDANLSVGKEREEAYNKSCYQKIAEQYDSKIEYHHVSLPSWVNDAPAVQKWTPGTLLRLYLPELLPNLNKIIYFDCDVVVNTNVDELWQSQLGDNYLAACLDSSIPDFEKKRKKYYSKMGINYNEYFCAGVLVLNLDKLRDPTRPFTKTVFSYFHKNQDLRFLDQDLLNWYCQGNYLHLAEKTNIYTLRDDAIDFADDCIIHYATKNSKPWIRYSGEIDDYYWKYFIHTPWGKDLDRFMSYLRMAPDIDQVFPLLSKDFLAMLNGDKKNKFKTTIKVIRDIIKSIGHWLLNFIRRPLIKIGILYD